MAIDVQTWKRLYNLFNPAQRLEVHEQNLFVTRPGSVAEGIAKLLSLHVERAGKWVVCGSTGSGKSSELVHLAHLLENTHTIVALDLLRSVPTINDVQPSEVLFAVGAGAVQVARNDLGYEVSEKLVEQLMEAFQGLLKEGHRVDLGALLQGVARFTANVAAPGAGEVAGAAAGAAAAVTGALGDRQDVRLGGMTRLGGLTRPVKEGEADLEKLRLAVNDVLYDLQKQRQIVVLIDGLDKIDDEDTIRRLFVSHRILTLPWAQIVYTAPIDLMLGPLWQAASAIFNCERLTNVLVHRPNLEGIDISDEELAEGRAAMRDVVRRRLLVLELALDDVFEPGALDVLIDVSGGHLRDLVQLVRRAVRVILLSEGPQIDRATAEKAVVEFRKEFEITLTTQTVEELRHVRQYGKVRSSDRDVRDLFLGGYILPYSNGRSWFEPHPILQGVRDEI